MAIRAWTDGYLRLALRLLQWASPGAIPAPAAPDSGFNPMQPYLQAA